MLSSSSEILNHFVMTKKAPLGFAIILISICLNLTTSATFFDAGAWAVVGNLFIEGNNTSQRDGSRHLLWEKRHKNPKFIRLNCRSFKVNHIFMIENSNGSIYEYFFRMFSAIKRDSLNHIKFTVALGFWIMEWKVFFLSLFHSHAKVS